jgi:Uma2 family endonuclease
VIEIRSPEDETYAKLPFLAKLGVREVIVIERDSKRVEVFALTGSAYLAQSSDTAGGVTSAALQVRFRTMPGARLLVNDTADPTVRTEI